MSEDNNKTNSIPTWACEPKLENCGLLVKKGDTIIETLKIINEKKCIIFGRNKIQCDIKLDHPSISRTHAIIAHGSSGNIYLMDLGSSHGTFKNGKRLESKKRDVLSDMDVIKFGASTREYIVRLDLNLPMPSSSSSSSSSSNNNHKRNLTTSHSTDINTDEQQQQQEQQEQSHQDNNNNNNDLTNKSKKKVVQVRCSHLLIKHKDSRRPQSRKNEPIEITREQALEKAKELRKQILEQAESEGEDTINIFQKLAAQESDCNSYKRGGDLGLFGLGKMQKPFEEAAFNLHIGELSQPVETASGVHLILRTQ